MKFKEEDVVYAPAIDELILIALCNMGVYFIVYDGLLTYMDSGLLDKSCVKIGKL